MAHHIIHFVAAKLNKQEESMRKLVLTVALLSGAAFAEQVEVDDCLIQEVLPGKHMTGAFVTFDNQTDHDVVLEAAAVPSISEHVELHEMKHQDGVMKMQEIEQFTLPPGKTAFKKGGYHVMITKIADLPEVGSEHEITFTFADGETASCTAKVASVDDVMAHFDDEKGEMHHGDDKHHDHEGMKHHENTDAAQEGHKHHS